MPPQLPPPLTPAQVANILTRLDETQGPRIVVISSLLIVITVVAVVLRFVARNIRKLPWMIDDYSMLPALVGCGKCFGVGSANGCAVLHRPTMRGEYNLSVKFRWYLVTHDTPLTAR